MNAIFLFLAFLALSQEPILTRWSDIAGGKAEENSLIKIRGFLYRQEDNWVLASMPNLRSCCIGAVQEQLLIEGDFSHASRERVIELSGVLRRSARAPRGWELANVEVIEPQGFVWAPFWIAGVSAGIFWAIFKLRRSKSLLNQY